MEYVSFQYTAAARPFVKWAGGKRSILPALLDRVPKQFTSYHEPFLGGGALFFALQPHKAYLSDINLYLIIVYRAIQNNIEEVITELMKHKQKHTPQHYQEARKALQKEQDPVKLAALFIYLNKTCYNGLYRVNKNGIFNVPIGKYEEPAVFNEKNLQACSSALRTTEIFQSPFTQSIVNISSSPKERFYYLDPPYHETYNGYSESEFGEKEHRELTSFCREIHKKGGYFMLSNSDTPLVRELYRGYTIETIQATRSISCQSQGRQSKNELIIRNYSQ
jgi:DNA adenine methylase